MQFHANPRRPTARWPFWLLVLVHALVVAAVSGLLL